MSSPPLFPTPLSPPHIRMSNYRSEYLKKRIRLYTPEKDEEARQGYFEVAKPVFNPSKKLLTLKDLLKEHQLEIRANLLGHGRVPKPANDNYSDKEALAPEDAEGFLNN